MKNTTRKISALVALVIVIGCMFAALPVSAEETTYTADLALDKTVDGNFFIGAWDVANGTVCAVETEATATWSPDWPGNWVQGVDHEAGGSYAVTQKTEGNADVVKFDMYPTDNETYGALVGFTAPADGTYNVNAVLNKVGPKAATIRLMKNDGTVIELIEEGERYLDMSIVKDGIELTAGEQILIVITRGNGLTDQGGYNVGFVSFAVTTDASAAPETNAPETNAPETNAPEVNNPSTSDSGIAITVAMVVVAGAAIAFGIKRR